MAFFLVTSTIRSGKDQNVSFAFDAPVRNLDELHDAFVRDGLVKGVRYRIIADKYDESYRLIDPRETLLGQNGFVTISPFLNIEKFDIETVR